MVEKQLIDKVEQIKTTLNEISVYNLDVYTAIELYYELAKKVNEVINELSRFEGVVSEEVVKQNETLTYLLGEGLTNAVVDRVNTLITNGTIQDLINNKIFNDLNTRLETYKQQTDEQINNIKNEKKAIFTFILDDAHMGDFYQAKPVFDEFGWVFSSALTPQRFWRDRNNGTCTSKLQPYLRYQEEQGMSLITHGLSHADLRNIVNENQVISEIIQGRKTVEKLGFKTCGFVPANSTVNNAYKHYLKENYSYAYNTYRGNITTMKGQGLKCYNTKQDDYHALLRISLADSVNSLEEIKSLIDEVVENKGFLTFYDHNIGNVGNASGTDASSSKLREILTYLKTYVNNGKCKVLSTDEAVAEYYGINLRYDTTKTYTTDVLKNVFTPNQTGATNANDVWYIPSPFTVVNDTTINLKLTSPITSGTSYQFYYNLDLSKIDLNDIENHIKVMLRSDVLTMASTQDIQLTIEGRFMNTSTGLNDVFKIWYERGTHKISLFPFNQTDDTATQLRIIFKITFNTDLNAVELNLTKPTIFI